MQSAKTKKRKNLKHSRSFDCEMPVTDTTILNSLDDCIIFPVEEIVQYPLPGYGAPTSISFSPDDSLITYLFSSDNSLNRKVFIFDPETCKQELVFGPPDGGLDESNISAEEKLRRERSRERGLGVTRYEWVKTSLKKKTIMVPSPAGVYFQDLSLQPELKLPSTSSSPIIDPYLSPDGTMLAFVRDYELHVLNLLNNESKQLIFGADGNGLRVKGKIRLVFCKSAKVRARPVEKDFEISMEALDLNERGTNVVDGGQDECGTQSKQLEVVAGKPLQGDFLLEPLIVNPKIELPLVIKKLINSTFDGLESGNQPIRSSEGSGGAYFMQDAFGQEYISVFKPIDEEPMAVNNPRGLPLSIDGEGLKKGTRVGEGALREVAAYLLDHPRSGPHLLKDTSFAGVPPTVMVKCLYQGFNFPEGYEYASKNIKTGSLQMFMKNCGSCEDMGPRAFPVDEVHKISVLDIRLANADRHAGNILVQRDSDGQIVLIPIDHGYCLPENFEDCTFDWLYWPQAHQPYSPDTIDYIRSLDADRDIELLKFYGWDLPLECARTLRISTMLLKKGAERGLTPFAIGSIMCRETWKKESVIEQIVQEAQEAVLPGTSEAAYLESVSPIMDRRLDELSP